MARQELELAEDIAEINNALAIILGNAKLLQREPGSSEDQKKKLEAIAIQVHRIARLLGSPGWGEE